MRRRRALAALGTALLAGCAGLNPAREPPPRGTVIGGDDEPTATRTPTTDPPGAAFDVTEWSPTSADGDLAVALTVTNGGETDATARLAVRVTLGEGATATDVRTDTDGTRYVLVTREVTLAAGATTTLTVETGVATDAWTGISFGWRPA